MMFKNIIIEDFIDNKFQIRNIIKQYWIKKFVQIKLNTEKIKFLFWNLISLLKLYLLKTIFLKKKCFIILKTIFKIILIFLNHYLSVIASPVEDWSPERSSSFFEKLNQAKIPRTILIIEIIKLK